MELEIGDLLNCNCNIIVQQLNCLCVKPHGLSAAISEKYPYANIYKQRRQLFTKNLAIPEDRGVPGHITWSDSNNPIIVGLYGQYDFGKAYPKSYRPKHDPVETRQLREEWFKQALDNLKFKIEKENMNHDKIVIAFPYQIGCGLAGGNWTNYEKMLQDFSLNINCKVKIIKLAN